MLNLSPEKLILVGMIAVVVLGPDRLPQAARTLGRFVAEMRRMSSGFESEVRGALAEPTEAFRSAVGEFRPPDVGRTVREAVTNFAAPAAAPGRAHPATPPPDTSGMPAAPDDPSLN
jgi:sec-independent protein translocase protein TatB